jgi:multidrug efflux pump subunit AcrA (membrane-fusion protein)
MAGTKSLEGVVSASSIEVRFAYSGKVSVLHVHPGDMVKPGTSLAELDRKILQAELDKQLADYEKARADFEIFVQKNPEPLDDFAKFKKQEQQALLNSSVKSVEITKYRLDQSVLFSPVHGVVLDDGGIRAGIYVTPGANSIKVLDLNSLEFIAPVTWAEFDKFSAFTFRVRLEGRDEVLTATLLPFVPPSGSDRKPNLRFRISPDFPVYPAMIGVVEYGEADSNSN